MTWHDGRPRRAGAGIWIGDGGQVGKQIRPGEPHDAGGSCLLQPSEHYSTVGHIERTPEPCYVVSTRTGQRTVDLICISADPTAQFTFLLEAKTSARPYTLPRDDARALLEYIQEVRGGLTTLPPLHFVLMVGPSPSATLEKKLQGLEAEARLPIRYCSADELAQLREVVAGPLPLNDFADHLLLASRVVPVGFAQTMRSRVDELRTSHEALVRTMLAPVR